VPTVIGVETAKGVETTYSVDATGEDVSWWIVKSFSPRGCHLHFWLPSSLIFTEAFCCVFV
jgi:hypothetical protein